MGKSIKQWENIVKKESIGSLKVLHDSLLKLSRWKAFDKEFDKEYEWTGYKTIKIIIMTELINRGVFK